MILRVSFCTNAHIRKQIIGPEHQTKIKNSDLQDKNNIKILMVSKVRNKKN